MRKQIFQQFKMQCEYVTFHTERWPEICKGCSESNASYFILLAQNTRCRWWCYGSGIWAIPPIFNYILLPCDTWQKWGILTSGISHGSVYEAKVWDSTIAKKNGTYWHSLMLAECFWKPNGECEHSEAVSGVFQQQQQWWERQATFWRAAQIFTSTACRLCFIDGENV